MATIIIQKGATLSGIAAQQKTTVAALMAANPQIKNPNLIIAGASLNIPTPTPAGIPGLAGGAPLTAGKVTTPPAAPAPFDPFGALRGKLFPAPAAQAPTTAPTPPPAGIPGLMGGTPLVGGVAPRAVTPTAPSNVITAATTAPVTPIVVPPVVQDTTNFNAITTAATTIPTPTLTPTPTATQTPTATETALATGTAASRGLIERIGTLTEQQIGKATFQAEQEAVAGITQQQRDIQDLTGQLGVIGAEQRAIPLKAQEGATGRGITVAGLAPIEAAAQRQQAIQALTVSAQLQARQGNLTLALSQVERAVSLKYAPIEAEILAKEKQLALLDKYVLTPLQTQRKEEAQAALALQKEQAAERKATESGINNIAMKLAENGINPDILKNATTVAEAIRIAGDNLRDPKARLELEKIRLDMEKTRKEISLMGSPTAKERKEEAAALASKAGQTGVLQDKLDLINTIETSSGLNQRVGSNILARIPAGFWAGVGKALTGVGIIPLVTGALAETTGSGQQFAGGVHRLTSTEFLNALISAKAQGATFGALTDREGDALRASATQLNDWEIKNDNGIGVGIWNIDERSFRAELNRLKELAQTAVTRVGGAGISAEEQTYINNVYRGTADPASLFNQ